MSAIQEIEDDVQIIENVPIYKENENWGNVSERPFESLKRLPFVLQTQELLNNLSILYMNKDIFEKIDCEEIIHSFSMAKPIIKEIK